MYIDVHSTSLCSLPLLFPSLSVPLFSSDEPNGRSSRDAELPRGDSQPMFLTNLHGYLHGQIPFFFFSSSSFAPGGSPADFVWWSKHADKEFSPPTFPWFESGRRSYTGVGLFRNSKYRKIRGDDFTLPPLYCCTAVKSEEPTGLRSPIGCLE